jgi:photosystem II stability/assembly factor-like uncharacterized protein
LATSSDRRGHTAAATEATAVVTETPSISGYPGVIGKESYRMTPPGRGLLRSRDGGGAWEAVGAVIPTESVALAVGPGDPIVMTTSKADIFRSRDGGRTWKAMLEQGRPVPIRP